MNLHQTPEEIIKAATPEQRILWNYIFLQTGERASISQYVYVGAAAGAEFLTYTARKFYFALQFNASNVVVQNIIPNIYLYNLANAIHFHYLNSAAYWDATAAAYRGIINNYDLRNIFFSRLAVIGYTYVQIIGYKIVY